MTVTITATETLDGETLMTSAQVEALFHICDRSVRNWVKQGFLLPIRIGHRVFFRRSDIVRMLSGNSR